MPYPEETWDQNITNIKTQIYFGTERRRILFRGIFPWRFWLKFKQKWNVLFPVCIIGNHAWRNFILNKSVSFNQWLEVKVLVSEILPSTILVQQLRDNAAICSKILTYDTRQTWGNVGKCTYIPCKYVFLVLIYKILSKTRSGKCSSLFLLRTLETWELVCTKTNQRLSIWSTYMLLCEENFENYTF